MPVIRTAAFAALLTALGLTVTGCGDARPSMSNPPVTGQAAPRPDGTRSATTDLPEQGARMRIQITIADSAAGRGLIAQLPLTIDMTDHGSVEKTGPLPSPLSTAGQPDGADPEVGDVGFYAPGNDLVLYYGDQSYYSGIVVLGRLDGEAAGRIADMDGAVTATIEVSAG
jgi:hypothetical protein